MIGRVEWFKYRTFGWGIAPKTWQSFVYVIIYAVVIGFALSIGIVDSTKMWIFGLLIAVFLADILHIMTNLPKVSDERENYHQLIIERNCSFAAIGALISIALYQTYQNRNLLSQNSLPFDASLVVVLGAMLLTKIASTIYVKMKK